MDITLWEKLITNVGFPIVCVIALGFFIYKFSYKIMDENKIREEKLYTIIGQVQTQNKELSNTNAGFVAVLNTYSKDLEGIKEDVTFIKNSIN